MKIEKFLLLFLFLTLTLFFLLNFNHLIKSKNKVIVDGIISAKEYNNKFSFDNDNFILYAEIIEDIVYFAIESTSKGWVAIGFDPVSAMKDADMIFGVVTDSEVKAYDTYSTGMFGPHPDDTSLNGTYDILSFAGKKENTKIIFEFSRKTDTKDSKDKILIKGKDIKLLWAYSSSTDIKSKHTKRGSSVIVIK
ncbi:MAG: DOMON domain-containing protein [Exilispira sp.]